MNVVVAVALVMLGMAHPLRAPDLQVEAATAAGANLPELADAVARALVAGGARVVLRGPASSPCQYCARVLVTETGPVTCRVEVSEGRHVAAATLHLPSGSPLLDRARAIAIQARLLVNWDTGGETRNLAARPVARKSESRSAAEAAGAASPFVMAEPSPSLARERDQMLVPPSEPASPPAREPAATAERRPDTADAAPARSAERAEAKPASRPEAKPASRPEAKPASQIESQPAAPARAEARLARAAEVQKPAAGPPKPQWPWIPTALGGAAAVAAGLCAVVARNRYNGLADRTQTYGSARALKSEGEKWQVASFVLAGAAAVGVGTGLVGFATRGSGGAQVTAFAAPLAGGGMLAIAGELP
jgi:hypothetical protein